MCGFMPTDAAADVVEILVGVDWAADYTKGITDYCTSYARTEALNDLDNQNMECSSSGYLIAKCIIDQYNELYDAYMGCQKLATFKKNDE